MAVADELIPTLGRVSASAVDASDDQIYRCLMSMHPLISGATVFITIVAMEVVATAVHRYVMHGFGWGWHQSHHASRDGAFELNDLYAFVFAGISILLFWLGGNRPALWWVALGMVGYGILYGLLHDALVHRRLPFPRAPRSGYLKRLVQAHRLHHAIHVRHGAVSFGFLYAPPVSRLTRQLRRNGGVR